MIRMQYQQVLIHWHALRAALATVRDEDEGMATLEVVVIAVGLFLAATGLIAVIKTYVTTQQGNIK